mgnify:CR=1 FL=1
MADANPSPPETPISSQLIMLFSMFTDANVILMSIDPKMTQLLNNTIFLKMGTYNIGGNTISFPGAKLSYASKYSDVEDTIYATESNGIAIDWSNVGSNDELTNPIFKIYHQSTLATPERDIYTELRDAAVKMRYQQTGNYDENFEKSMILHTKVAERALANAERKTRMSGIAVNVAMITALSVIISSMPDMEKIFEEKDNHVSALSFMMGMKESAFWFTNRLFLILFAT